MRLRIIFIIVIFISLKKVLSHLTAEHFITVQQKCDHYCLMRHFLKHVFFVFRAARTA